MATMVAGHWLPSHRSDPRAVALYRRHYSCKLYAGGKPSKMNNFMGPGETMVLLTEDCSAVFAWQYNTVERYDKQEGVCCTLFRNESDVLSSELIREASDLAWQRWPGKRLFTYVNDDKVRKKRDPGRCFRKAGWRVCGRNKDGRLTILEVLPSDDVQACGEEQQANCPNRLTKVEVDE